MPNVPILRLYDLLGCSAGDLFIVLCLRGSLSPTLHIILFVFTQFYFKLRNKLLYLWLIFWIISIILLGSENGRIRKTSTDRWPRKGGLGRTVAGCGRESEFTPVMISNGTSSVLLSSRFCRYYILVSWWRHAMRNLIIAKGAIVISPLGELSNSRQNNWKLVYLCCCEVFVLWKAGG